MIAIENLKNTILSVLKNYDIKRAGIFGSYAKASHTIISDVDVLVELENKISLLEFVKIKLELEDALKKEVDLVEYKTIKPRLKNKILSEEIRIYG